MPQITWILVNCNSEKEAKKIGSEVLKRRLISCFEIIPRLYAAYFWPPRSGKIETSKGATLILETLKRYIQKIEKEVKKIHSDRLPFIGSIEIQISQEYFNWVGGELRK